MYKLLTLALITAASSIATAKPYLQENDFEGTFVIITKSRSCEFVKTYTIFQKDHSFKLYSTCNGADRKQFAGNKAVKGHWSMINDSIITVSIVKRPTMEFKILSDSLIEWQNGNKFNKPQYKRVVTLATDDVMQK